jgi:hypothetical protein
MKNTHYPGKTLCNTSSSKPITLDTLRSQFLVPRAIGVRSEATVKNQNCDKTLEDGPHHISQNDLYDIITFNYKCYYLLER